MGRCARECAGTGLVGYAIIFCAAGCQRQPAVRNFMEMRKFIWILLVAGWHGSHAQNRGLRVFVFLSPECPLCQNYTRTLNQLNQQYAGKISFYGIIPGSTWKQTDLTAFAEKYHVDYPLQLDRDLHVSRALHATTTPEAILIGPDSTVLYKGAIDNWYKTLGKPSRQPTQHYLQDAIESTLRHESPPVRSTDPIGCLINDF